MRFKNNQDYEKTVDLFLRLKFPIRNAGNKTAPTAPPRPARPASASLIPTQSQHFHAHQTSDLYSAKTYAAPAAAAISSTSYDLPRPFSPAESPFFTRSHTASSETVRPRSSISLENGRPLETVSSMSFGELFSRPNSVLQSVGRESSIFLSQLEREVCIYSLQ
jgi:hypothetical protein